jgi:MFS-type transporter involved in bile tolerance (Atg22 family)
MHEYALSIAFLALVSVVLSCIVNEKKKKKKIFTFFFSAGEVAQRLGEAIALALHVLLFDNDDI